MTEQLISNVTIGDYLWGTTSLFRRYQTIFLERYGRELTGRVLELGGEKAYQHARFFPNATSFVCTNIARDYDQYVDITAMPFADGTQDGYVCISVLEHVYDIQKALAEIHRTLKVGGKLLLVVPFGYPFHDDVDYWRLSRGSYQAVLEPYEVRAFVHLGGMISTVVDVLQRPKRKLNRRYLAYKSFGLLIAVTLRRFDRLDGFPLGYGVYAVKK